MHYDLTCVTPRLSWLFSLRLLLGLKDFLINLERLTNAVWCWGLMSTLPLTRTFFVLYFQNVDHKMKFKSTKGQLPFVELNGEEIADSALIMTKLAQHFGTDPDAQLTKEERNSSHALISMIENHLCWVYVYWRSKNPDSMIKVSQGSSLQSQALKSRQSLIELTHAFLLHASHNSSFYN